MPLTATQIKQLLELVSTTQDDCLDCAGCFDHIAEFAESELLGQPLNEALQTVKIHLESCHCCLLEYEALRDALQGMDE